MYRCHRVPAEYVGDRVCEVSRPFTEEEVLEAFMDQARGYARYWAREPNKTREEMCMGLLHSLLVIIDGESALPAFDLVVRPHPDDKQYAIDEDSDYYEDGQVINKNAMLHDSLYRPNPNRGD